MSNENQNNNLDFWINIALKSNHNFLRFLQLWKMDLRKRMQNTFQNVVRTLIIRSFSESSFDSNHNSFAITDGGHRVVLGGQVS